MPQTIKLKRSNVPGRVPTTTDLSAGELGINTYDGKVYYKRDNGSSTILSLGVDVRVNQTATLNAQENAIYLLNGTTTVNLPSAADGAYLGISDHGQNFSSSPVTLIPASGHNISGLSSLTLDTTSSCVLLGFAGGRWSFLSAESFISASVSLKDGVLSSARLTTTTTAANQVVVSIPIAQTQTVRFLIQVRSGSSYQATEILSVHDGSTVYLTEYGTVLTNGVLALFDADISSGDLRLLVTPNNADTTIKTVYQTINT